MNDLDFCNLSALAYAAPADIEVGDVHAIVRYPSATEAVIAFRGTVESDLADWLRDLDGFPEWDSKLGLCHRGFLLGARGALGRVQAATEGRTLSLTGHSLGAALAALTGALLIASGRQVRQIVTFGCPRVGYSGVREALAHLRCARYVHGDDAVPGVPSYMEHHTAAEALLSSKIMAPIGNHMIATYAAALASSLVTVNA